MTGWSLRNRSIYNCNKCTQSFKNMDDLNTHINEHTDKIGEKPNKDNKCDKNSRINKQSKYIEINTGENKLREDENYVDYNIIAYKTLEMEIERQNDKCNESFTGMDELNTHINDNIGNNTDGEKLNVSINHVNETSILNTHIIDNIGNNADGEKLNVSINHINETSILNTHINDNISNNADGEKPNESNNHVKETSINTGSRLIEINTAENKQKEDENYLNKDIIDYENLDMEIEKQSGEKPINCNICNSYIYSESEGIQNDKDLALKFKFSLYEKQINKNKEDLECKENFIKEVEKKLKDTEKVRDFYKNVLEKNMKDTGKKFCLENENILEYINRKEDDYITKLLEDMIVNKDDKNNEIYISVEQYNELLKENEKDKLKLNDNEKIIKSLSDNLYRTTNDLMDKIEGEKEISNEINIFKKHMEDHAIKMTNMKNENEALMHQIEEYVTYIRELENKMNRNELRNRNEEDKREEYDITKMKGMNQDSYKLQTEMNLQNRYDNEERIYSTKTYYNEKFMPNRVKSLDNRNIDEMKWKNYNKSFNNNKYSTYNKNQRTYNRVIHHGHENENQNNNNSVCTHFLRGYCKFGNQCFKEHRVIHHGHGNEKQNVNKSICTHFLKGQCKFGDHCFKEHRLVICSHYSKGMCKFGDNCWKIHATNMQ